MPADIYLQTMSVQLREMRRRLSAAKADAVGFCQPSVAPTPPNGPGWFHEIKHDGYRLAVGRDSGGIRLITRNGHDWAGRYPSIVSAANALRCRSCIIDGEVVVTDKEGLADFSLLRHGRQVKPEAFLYAFDLLELDGRDLKRQAIEDRKAALANLLGREHERRSIHLVEHLDFDDADMIFEHACVLGCEGIVSKRKGSRYRAGRSRDWLKTKNPAAPWAKRLEEEDWK
jgi:bifunctional non-homologous end joining protein LigD